MATRLPVVRDGVTVIECDGDGFRALSVASRRGEPGIDSIEVHDGPPSLDALSAILSRFRTVHDAVLVVSDEVLPGVLHGEAALTFPDADRSGAVAGWTLRHEEGESRCVFATTPHAHRSRWSETMSALGLRLEGLYPLVGTALAGVQDDARPLPGLLLQLERNRIALIERLGSSCRALDVFDEPPEVKRCAELIGEGCPEVALCGRGVDLSAFGYDLVQACRSWVRLPQPRLAGSALSSSFASAVGAVRHAFGLVAVDAVACVPAERT